MPLTRLPLGAAVSGNLDLANHVTGTLPAANYKAGSIIQVTDQVVISTLQTLSTDTYTDLTSATLTITPSSTSSKILLQAGINCKHDTSNSGYGIKYLRDGTGVFTTTQNYLQYHNSDNDRSYCTITYVDSPSSTSQLTYKIQVSTHSSRTIQFQNSAQSTFIAMEIAG